MIGAAILAVIIIFTAVLVFRAHAGLIVVELGLAVRPCDYLSIAVIALVCHHACCILVLNLCLILVDATIF